MNRRTVFLSILLAGFPALAQQSITVFNAARGTLVVAPGSLASAFGTALSAQTAFATTLPLPQSLGDVNRVAVTDSSGVTRLAGLIYVSPTQVNFVVPTDVPLGTNFIAILNGNGRPAQGAIIVEGTAAGLFSANGTGAGVAAAIGIRVIDVVGPQVSFPIFSCTAPSSTSPATCQPLPIDLGVDTPTFLALFGTGIRGGQKVTATVGGQPVPVLYAGAQGYPGLDQVNIALPLTLRGAGLVDVVVTTDGDQSNPVQILIQ